MSGSESPFHVLLVEDNPGDARLIQIELDELGERRFELCTVDQLGPALQRLERERFDVMLLDLSLPDSQGIDTVLRASGAMPDLPIVVLTGLDDEELAVTTMQRGAQDYLVKGCMDGRALARSMRYAIERKRAEVALREVTTLQRAILDSANYAIIATSPEGIVCTFNAAAQRWLGYTEEEVIGKMTPAAWHDPAEVAARAAELSQALGDPVAPGFEVLVARARRGEIEEREWTYVRRDGSRFPVLLSVTALHEKKRGITGFLGVVSDITERKKAEAERERLLASEREKSEQLQLSVREAHHRIKNNLQAITDLLYLELASNNGAKGTEALRESMDRIQAIALVHDLLSQDRDVRIVDTRELTEALVPMALRSSMPDTGGVDLRLEVPQFPLSSKKATSLALILNELITNAAKHAFKHAFSAGHACPGPAGGKLYVTLYQEGEELVLRVQDNGPGLPPGFDMNRDSHVGLDVVRILAERDLNGRFSLTHGDGVLAEVRFPW